jgi:plasmid maintenance system antidote protein VapI
VNAGFILFHHYFYLALGNSQEMWLTLSRRYNLFGATRVQASYRGLRKAKGNWAETR